MDQDGPNLHIGSDRVYLLLYQSDPPIELFLRGMHHEQFIHPVSGVHSRACIRAGWVPNIIYHL
jgi:hypothetical protein